MCDCEFCISVVFMDSFDDNWMVRMENSSISGECILYKSEDVHLLVKMNVCFSS